ncbi:hypothetical protein GQ53DRAFT_100703 [Thozetella sp. PMI_491]|nr:hypothetical protein GQ53DRAFT_100703 [Thozetella sp. PMI_491]
MAIFNAPFIEEVRRVRKMSGPAILEPDNASSPVYVVSRHVHGQWVDFEAEVLGVYDHLPSANEHAMGFFAEEYDHQLPRHHDSDSDGEMGTTEFQRIASWKVDDTGCLSFHLDEGKSSDVDITVVKQTIRRCPPDCIQPTTATLKRP